MSLALINPYILAAGSGGVSETLVFEDTFTVGSNTDLQNHTPDIGAGWTVPQGGLLAVATTDKVVDQTTGDNFGRITDIISADHAVEMQFFDFSDRLSVLARYTHNGTDDFDGYMLHYNPAAAAEMQLYRVQNGSATLLAGSGPGLSSGDRIKIEVIGSSIKAYKNDVEVLSATDSVITSGGAGFRMKGAQNIKGDNFKVWEIA